MLSFLKIIIFQISSKLLISLFVRSALFLDLPSLRRTISCLLGPDKIKFELWAAESLNHIFQGGTFHRYQGCDGDCQEPTSLRWRVSYWCP